MQIVIWDIRDNNKNNSTKNTNRKMYDKKYEIKICSGKAFVAMYNFTNGGVTILLCCKNGNIVLHQISSTNCCIRFS